MARIGTLMGRESGVERRVGGERRVVRGRGE
jgi:hypothetical protein